MLNQLEYFLLGVLCGMFILSFWLAFLRWCSKREGGSMPWISLLVCGLALAATGCSSVSELGGALASRVSVETNIPYHGSVLTVMNQTDAPFNIFVDGQPGASVAPGGLQALSFYDFSGGYGQHSLQVVGPKGATSRSISVSGNYQSSETWIITTSDLRR